MYDEEFIRAALEDGGQMQLSMRPIAGLLSGHLQRFVPVIWKLIAPILGCRELEQAMLFLGVY